MKISIIVLSHIFFLGGFTQGANKIDNLSFKNLTKQVNAENIDSYQAGQEIGYSHVAPTPKVSTDTLKILDSLLLPLYDISNSKNISQAPQAKKIISYGKAILPALSQYFTDTTQTKIKSECQNFKLNHGEVAMILADRIETMPYFQLTYIQNCTLQFCEGNSNLVEFYFSAIRRDNVKLFQERYMSWLKSEDRKKIAAYMGGK